MSQHPKNKFFLTKPDTLKVSETPTAHKGYGLMLLLVFLASTVLTLTSLSLVLAPSTASYIGSVSINNSIGQNIATFALDAAQSDILTQLSNGNTVDTTYRYPASGTTPVSIPSYPGSGANTTVGTYFVTVTKARGQTYILQATVAYNNATSTASRLVQLNGSSPLYKNAYAAYSLRKLYSSYAGKAANVRCATTSTTTDIGFTAGGDFDVAALRTCLGEDLPLNVDSTAKAAYSLRKLNTSYAGYAIKVRRSSDNTTQDIGFNSFGNLDTKSLLTFVGTNSGYIDTWYDQSGNGLNQTQATLAKQPRIVNAGVIDKQNGIPAIYFGGSQNLANSSFSGVVTGQELRFFTVAETASGGAIRGQFAALYKSGDPDSYSTASGMEVLRLGSALTSLASNTNNNGSYMTQTVGILFQATTYHNSSGSLKLYYDGTLGFTQAATDNLAPTSLILGTGAGGDASSYITGYMAEAILYNSAVTAGNQSKIEYNQEHYYKISGYTDGFVTKWYDQSGHGYDIAQATTTAQPIIDVSGSAPAVFIDITGCSNGSVNCDYLANSSLSQTLTPMSITAMGVGQLSPTVGTSWGGRMFSVYKTGSSDDRNSNSAALLMQQSGSPGYMGSKKDSDATLNVANTVGSDFQVTSLGDGTNRTFRSYQTSTGLGTSTTATYAAESLVMNNFRVGINDGLNSNANWDGRINEIIFWTTALGSSTYQTYETAQRTYYGI